jgi:4-amino-4-deoxy-L-arabinose transferase-like glycosyltransferase
VAIALLVTVAVALGLFLRLLAISSVPFYEDDYSSALQVAGIMQTGKPTFPSGWVQWAEPVALPYLISILWRITGPDIMVGRLLSALLGTLSIGAAYLLGRRVHSPTTGAIFALLVAVNLWSVASSAYFRHYALAELSFLLICDLAVRWLRGRRSLGAYLAVLGGSALLAVIGHYILLPVILVVAMLPAIGKLSDVVGSRLRVVPGGPDDTGRTVRIDLRMDLILVLVMIGLSVAAAGFIWALPRYGILIPQVIGKLTGEFFTVLPEHARISFRPFFVQSLLKFYGPWLLVSIGAGALVLVIQAGRSGLAILLYFALPFVLLSTIFASLTVTSMFDRYLFPFNPALLLMLASFVVWASDRLARWLIQSLRTRREYGEVLAPVVAGALAVMLLTQAGAVVALPVSRLPGEVETWIRSRNEPETPSYRRASTFLKAHMAVGDIVLGSRPLDLVFELPHASGYWLMSDPQELSEVGVWKDGRLVNRYTGYPAITDLGQFLKLMAQSPNLWVVLPHFHDSPGTLSPGMWGVVHSWMERVPDASDATIALYRSPRQRAEVISLRTAMRAYGNARGVVAINDRVTRFQGRPGPVNWAGVEYRLPADLRVTDVIFDVSMRVDQVSGGTGTVGFDVILEESDGDRWHAPGRLRVEAGDRWQRFLLPFSYLRFWPLGKKTPQPHAVRSLKIEVNNARHLAFQAEIQMGIIRRVPGTP